MNFVTVSCGVNQNYLVSEEVFEKLFKQVISETKNVKLVDEPRISFAKDLSNVSFVVDVRIKKNKPILETINNLRDEFESRFVSLLDIKPQSVRICFDGYY